MLTRFLTKPNSVNATLIRNYRTVSSFATFDPFTVNKSKKAKVQNLVGGKWKDAAASINIIDPLNGEEIFQVPNTNTEAELKEFRDSLLKCPIYGAHNPFLNVSRLDLYADVCFKAAVAMREPEIEEFFIKAIQRVCPKSYIQAKGEVVVTRQLFETMGGHGTRFLNRGILTTGTSDGQQAQTYRWPYGPVMHIAPFNFPLEIPILQMISALIMGNKIVVKPD
jgi:1-pyrroline-5-carboxylate dehydrogenase